MKLLVTGGCGFIGTNFILDVINQHTVVNLDKLTYAGVRDNLKHLEGTKRYTFIHGDICDAQLVSSLMKDVDCVVHFAAESHVDRSIEKPNTFIQTNVLGTLTLLQAAKKYNVHFHHISTDEVFGQLGKTGVFNEHTAYNPRSPYAASKAASDHLVRSFHATYDLPITISNCSNNYGPYQFPEKIIPLFVTNILQGKKVPVYGEGKNIRDWLHVQDHVAAIKLILEKGIVGETYCVGGGEELTNLALAKKILYFMDVTEDHITFVEDRKGHDFRYAIDAAKIKKLGWKPTFTFEEGLQKTIAWYKEQKTWWKAHT